MPPPAGTSSGRRVQVGLLLQRQGALIALVVLILFGVFRYGERFATGYNLSSFTGDTAKYGLVALGMTFVIMTGGIDLSVGSVAALGGVVAVKVSEHGLLVGLLAGTAAGAAVGVLNGFLITKLKLPPFIVTLATLLAIRGLALNLAHTRAAVAAPGGFQKLGQLVPARPARRGMGDVPRLPSRRGRGALHALGSQGPRDRRQRRRGQAHGPAGARTTFSVYVLSGALAGCAGVFLGLAERLGRHGGGQGWELSAIAAVVVGGTLLTGGVGRCCRRLVGVLLLQLIFNLIVFENGKGFINISSFWESVIRGGLPAGRRAAAGAAGETARATGRRMSTGRMGRT